MGSALACDGSVLKLAGNDCAQHRLTLTPSHRSHPDPSCYQNLATYTQLIHPFNYVSVKIQTL